MTAMSKQSLIFESVAVIQIDIRPTLKEPDQYIIRVASRASRTTTVNKVPIRLKLGLCSRDEVLAHSDRLARPSS
jgi:hypothetical protein